jgi:hypothetical protein
MVTMGAAVSCPICAQPHVACGPAAPVEPVDLPTASHGEPYTMADLKEYRYTVNGQEITALLTEKDAARLNAVLVEPAEPATVKAQTDVPNTARSTVPNAARPGPPNKAR